MNNHPLYPKGPFLHDFTSEAVQDSIRFINQNREELIRAWIAATGCHPCECQLVEDRTDPNMIRVWVEKRERDYEKELKCD